MDEYAGNMREKMMPSTLFNRFINVLNMMSGNLKLLTLHDKQCEERFKVKVAIFKP